MRQGDKARRAAELYLAGEIETVKLAAERVGVSHSSVAKAVMALKKQRREAP